MHIEVHIQNRVMLRNNTDKTPYELWKGRPENVKHFRVFGSKFYIKREDGRMGKFDSRVDKGVLVGYSSTRKAYKCYNMILNKVVESINVKIDETGGPKSKEEEKNMRSMRSVRSMRLLTVGFLPDPISEKHMETCLTKKTRINTPSLRNI
jgi:hypothetical protein